MDWITQAAKEREDRRLRRETIAAEAPALWERVIATMEQAVKDYDGLADRPRQVKLSGRSANALHVAIFEKRGQSFGIQLARVAIVFDRKQSVVEIRATFTGLPRKFPIGLNADRRACLTVEGREISLEDFTKAALYDVLFPKDESSALDSED